MGACDYLTDGKELQLHNCIVSIVNSVQVTSRETKLRLENSRFSSCTESRLLIVIIIAKQFPVF